MPNKSNDAPFFVDDIWLSIPLSLRICEVYKQLVLPTKYCIHALTMQVLTHPTSGLCFDKVNTHKYINAFKYCTCHMLPQPVFLLMAYP